MIASLEGISRRTSTEWPPKALLLRVGIDRGTGGALGPIFADGTFEYVPIPEERPTKAVDTYETLTARHGGSLAAYLPARLASRRTHIDPDFDAATYGDALPRKRLQLDRLGARDLLVFYSGLAPFPADDVPRLFVIGYFLVKRVWRLTAADIRGDDGLRRRFGKTAHFLRSVLDRDLVLVEGYMNKSRLFSHAVPLSDDRQYLLRDLSRLFGYQGSLQRAVGHWIAGDAALRKLSAWLDKGAVSLLDSHKRLFRCRISAVRSGVFGTGDLVIADKRLQIGDWVVVWDDRQRKAIFILARVNEIGGSKANAHAFSSLFWHFHGGVPDAVSEMARSIVSRLPKRRQASDTYAIRRLVHFIGSRYRIGYHSISKPSYPICPTGQSSSLS